MNINKNLENNKLTLFIEGRIQKSNISIYRFLVR